MHRQFHQGGAARRVTRRVVEQVADQAGEQPALALHRCGIAGEVGSGARGLLGGESLQVDRLQVPGPLQSTESAGQQDLLDQPVELLDIALDTRPECGVAVLRQQLDGHADSRQRRAQLVGGGGERVALRLDEGLDALGRTVEAAGERGDLVLALDLDPGGEIARAQRLDPHLQPFKPPREPAGQRPGADGDGEREQGEGREEADRRRVGQFPLRAHQDQAAVRQRQGERPAPPTAPAGEPLFRYRQGLAQAAEQPAVRSEHADAGVEVPAHAGEGGLDLGPRCAGRRQRLHRQRADAAAEIGAGALLVGQPPAQGGEHAEEHDDAEQRQIDLEEEPPSHEPPSPRSSSSWWRAKR